MGVVVKFSRALRALLSSAPPNFQYLLMPMIWNVALHKKIYIYVYIYIYIYINCEFITSTFFLGAARATKCFGL